jgi:hypothetical protein
MEEEIPRKEVIEEAAAAEEQGGEPAAEVHIPLNDAVVENRDEVNSPEQPPEHVITADEATAFDANRAANEQGWEGTAKQFNKRRPFSDQLLGKNKTTAMDIAQDEAQRIDDTMSRETDPTIHRGEYATPMAQSNTEALERVLRQKPFDRYSTNEFETDRTPNSQATAARSIEHRERVIKPISDKVLKALEEGDIEGAGKACGEYYDSSRFRPDRNTRVTFMQHTAPALTKLTSEIFGANNAESLDALLSSELAPFLEGVIEVPAEQRKSPEMSRVIEQQAVKATHDLVPQIWHNDGGWSPEEVLAKRIQLLENVGGISDEEFTQNHELREAATEEVLSLMVSDMLRGIDLRFPYEGFQLEKLGLISREEFVDNPRVKRAATIAVAGQSKSTVRKTEKALRSAIIGEETASDPEHVKITLGSSDTNPVRP